MTERCLSTLNIWINRELRLYCSSQATQLCLFHLTVSSACPAYVHLTEPVAKPACDEANWENDLYSGARNVEIWLHTLWLPCLGRTERGKCDHRQHDTQAAWFNSSLNRYWTLNHLFCSNSHRQTVKLLITSAFICIYLEINYSVMPIWRSANMFSGISSLAGLWEIPMQDLVADFRVAR